MSLPGRGASPGQWCAVLSFLNVGLRLSQMGDTHKLSCVICINGQLSIQVSCICNGVAS